MKRIKNFFKLESASGFLLLGAAVIALTFDNSSLRGLYHGLLDAQFTLGSGKLSLTKSVLSWINDGLMTLFFLVVGLELKRELKEGQLAHFSQAMLPIFAALGGMIMPALIYAGLNYHDAGALRGWAIPVATDIAFALGVLSLLKNRIPLGLKIFLTALAIIDDIGAILIIAFFHAGELSFIALGLAVVVTVFLGLLNYLKITSLAAFGILGFILWVCVLKSGVHATIAGVILAFLIPMRAPSGVSVLGRVEKALHPWAAFCIVPLFAFANAGIPFEGLSCGVLMNPIPLGIIAGLVVGKQCGVFGVTWLAVRCKVGQLPPCCTWRHVYGLSLLCGIGFTMSLFIGMLAVPDGIIEVRIGVIVASLISGLLGYMVLRFSSSELK